MKNLTTAQVRTLGALLLVVLLLVSWFLILAPQYRSLTAAREEATAEIDRTATLQTQLTGLKKQCADLDAAASRFQQFGSSFPSSAQQQALLDTIVATGVSKGVQVTNITPETPKISDAVPGTEPGTAVAPAAPDAAAAATAGTAAANGAEAYPLAQVNLSITGVGSAAQARDFVAAVEGLQPSVLVDSVTVSTVRRGGDVQNITVSGRTFLTRDSGSLDSVRATCAKVV